jgi:hypothetical protein
MRIAAHQKVAMPPTDDTIGNAWMTDNAERLIRYRAKYELFMHIIRNTEQAQVMAGAVQEAIEVLKGETNRLVGRGIMNPMEM